ncbi:putative nucleoside transporter YegT [subsurface metagenome]
MIFSSRFRLSQMMLIQYMMFAVWWVPFAAYLANIDISGARNAMMLSSMAIGCLAAPLIGMVADRYFSSEKVLAVLNLLSGILWIIAGFVTNHDLLFILLILSMLCHMPTWSLTSSIAMTHAPAEQFPRIRVFGSIGWVAAGLFSVISVKLLNTGFDGTNIPFFYAGSISLIACLFNLTLPSTPPPAKGKKGSLIDVFGLRTVKLMADRNFAAFIIISFLSVIPFSMYFSYCSEFLLDKGFKFISVTMNWGQLVEMFIMISIPFAIRKIGLRNTMVFGLFALLIRYLAFYAGVWTGTAGLYFIGILIHGFVFGYFYVGGQIYIDKKTPAELRAQAQGFFFLVNFGLGLLVGNFISRQIIENYSSVIDNSRSYNWESIWGVTAVLSLVVLLAFLLFFKNSSRELKT